MTLTKSEEQKLKAALGVVVNEAPPGLEYSDLGARSSTRRTGAQVSAKWAAAAAFIVVALALTPVAFLTVWNNEEPAAPLVTPTSPSPESLTADTAVTTPTTVDDLEGFDLAPALELAGSDRMVTLQNFSVVVSSDGGATWEPLYEFQHELDLLVATPDGSVAALRNPNSYSDALGPDSIVNDPVEFHHMDDETGEWIVTALPRPVLASDLNPSPVDGGCGLGGLQHWVDAIAGTTSDIYVVVGDMIVVAEGVCSETTQLLWTSPDGTNWTIEEIDIDGFVFELAWTGDRYVAFGSNKAVSRGGVHELRIWTSNDLVTWNRVTVDLSVIPDRARVLPWFARGADDEGARLLVPGDGSIAARIPLAGSPFHTDIAHIGELREVLAAIGWEERTDADEANTLEGVLAMLQVTFPLDEQDVLRLISYWQPSQPAGHLILRSNGGLVWTSEYSE